MERVWYLIDATDKTVGRLATHVATLLRGKDKADYLNRIDSGAFVVIVNADKIVLTGKKMQDKIYRWHSGHPGGLNEKTFAQIGATKALHRAIKGMLPHNRLADKMIVRLKIYEGNTHPHTNHKFVEA